MVLKGLFKGLDKKYLNSLLRASLIGIHLVLTTFIGLGIGYFLDLWLGTSPWLTMIFFFMGVIAGFMNMFQEGKKIQESDKSSPSSEEGKDQDNDK